MAKSIQPADWADYERARLIEQARKRNQTAEDRGCLCVC